MRRERTRRLFPREAFSRYRIDALREENLERERDRENTQQRVARTLESGAARTYVTPARNTAFII